MRDRLHRLFQLTSASAREAVGRLDFLSLQQHREGILMLSKLAEALGVPLPSIYPVIDLIDAAWDKAKSQGARTEDLPLPAHLQEIQELKRENEWRFGWGDAKVRYYLAEAERHAERAAGETKQVSSSLRKHVEGAVDLLQTLVGRVAAYQNDGFNDLVPQMRRLVYVFANHLANLGRRPGGGFGPGDERQVKSLLETLGIHGWTIHDRLAWCRHCNYDPLYTHDHETCTTCGSIKCPNCGGCRLRRPSCMSTKAPPPPAGGSFGEHEETDPGYGEDDIPF